MGGSSSCPLFSSPETDELLIVKVEEAEKTPETTVDYEVSADGDPDVINIKLPVRDPRLTQCMRLDAHEKPK